MKNGWNIYEWIKKIIRVTFWILAFIIVLAWSIFVYINESEHKNHDETISKRLEIVKDMFMITWDYVKDAYNTWCLDDYYYFPDSDKTIAINNYSYYTSIFEWENQSWCYNYWTKWYRINDYDWYVFMFQYSWYDSDGIIYSLELLKVAPDWWDFYSNPSNYRVSGVKFFDDYYRNYVEKSGDMLVWPNWAYYEWEYDDNLMPNGKWVMHYFWTDISKQVKITDNLILDVDESCWYNNAWFIFSWLRDDFQRDWYCEYYAYYYWWNRVDYLTWVYVKWNPLYYDIYGYQKINKNWWNFIDDPDSYKLMGYTKENVELWTKEQHLTTLDWIPFTIITDPNINSGNYVYYYNNDKNIANSYNPDWIWWMISELDSIEPTLSWWMLYYWDKAIYSWDIEYIDWKPIKSGYWILKFNTCDTAYLSWNWWQQAPNSSWDIIANYRWYWEYVWNCWPNITWQKWNYKYYDILMEFDWELYDNDNSYYKWIINENGYFEWDWLRKDTDLEYYSGNRNSRWSYDWYWVFRLYNETIPWWNFIDNEENYEIIYELSWYWYYGDYIWKIKPKEFFD